VDSRRLVVLVGSIVPISALDRSVRVPLIPAAKQSSVRRSGHNPHSRSGHLYHGSAQGMPRETGSSARNPCSLSCLQIRECVAGGGGWWVFQVGGQVQKKTKRAIIVHRWPLYMGLSYCEHLTAEPRTSQARGTHGTTCDTGERHAELHAYSPAGL